MGANNWAAGNAEVGARHGAVPPPDTAALREEEQPLGDPRLGDVPHGMGLQVDPGPQPETAIANNVGKRRTGAATDLDKLERLEQ